MTNEGGFNYNLTMAKKTIRQLNVKGKKNAGSGDKNRVYDVIIIGGGPIGLMLGNLLGEKKFDVLILEKETRLRTSTRAIGITPPSLNLLKRLGLSGEFIKKGGKGDSVVVHGTNSVLGEVNFDSLENDFRFILSIPQNYSESILESNLKKYKTVRLVKGMEAVAVNKKGDFNEVRALDKKGNASVFNARFIGGCDGNKSVIRSAMNIKFRGGRYRDTFLMADYRDRSGLGREAHLFFTSKGPVESFPLPDGRRRWIVATDGFMEDPPPGFLENEVLRRAGINIKGHPRIDESPFGVQHYISDRYYCGGAVFCGDSCHVMSPIGGQGMNTGFADADLCALVLENLINNAGDQRMILRKYEAYRKKAAVTAMRRAWMSMRVGTVKGRPASFVRNALVVILVKILKNRIPPYFSMLTIPYSTLEKVMSRDKSFFKNNKFEKSEE